jgi:hypothetical protein
MSISNEQKIRNIFMGIKINNEKIEKANKENQRYFLALEKLGAFPLISQEKKERYDEELSTDNWKKYSKRYIEQKSRII